MPPCQPPIPVPFRMARCNPANSSRVMLLIVLTCTMRSTVARYASSV